MEKPISGAGYYYGTYTATRFNLSSLLTMVRPDDLKAAGAKASLQPSLLIETFEDGWEKEWFSYKPKEWPRKTHKVYDPQWAAPEGAKLALEVRSTEANKLVIGIDKYAAEVQLEGEPSWQKILVSPADFKNVEGAEMPNWSGIRELRLGDKETQRDTEKNLKVEFGGVWQGADPAFRNVQWIRGSDAD